MLKSTNMKKIITVLFASAMLSKAFAQYEHSDRLDWNKNNDVYKNNNNRGYDKHNNGNYGYGKPGKGYNDRYVFTARDRDMQIEQINRNFDYNMRSIRNQYFINRNQKIRRIRLLEEKRDREINEVMYKFNDRRNQCDNNGRGRRKDW